MASDNASRRQNRALLADYANYFEVGHNAFEFLIDFGQIDPQSGDVNINSRIAVGPTHAKLFSRLMEGAVAQFEDEFGAIPDASDGDPLGTVLDPSPDFERRAIDARRRSSVPSPRPTKPVTPRKR